MSEDSFIHDEATFDPVETPSGVELDDAEARYAELFREVIWDGMISAEERDRLNEAAKLFGLTVRRVTSLSNRYSIPLKRRVLLQRLIPLVYKCRGVADNA